MVTKGGWAERPHDIMWVPVWDTPHLGDMERPPGGGWQEYQYGQMFASQSALHILLIKMCSTSYNICVYFSCQQLCSPSQQFTKKCELCGVKCCAGYALLFIKTKIGFLLWLGQGHRQDSHLHISSSQTSRWGPWPGLLTRSVLQSSQRETWSIRQFSSSGHIGDVGLYTCLLGVKMLEQTSLLSFLLAKLTWLEFPPAWPGSQSTK